MHVLRGLKRLLQFVVDPDMYCLLWLAIRNHFKGKKQVAPTPASTVGQKERAKTVNAG